MDVESSLISLYERNFLPIWHTIIVFWHFIWTLFSRKQDDNDIERTPLLHGADVGNTTIVHTGAVQYPRIRSGVPQQPLKLQLSEPWVRSIEQEQRVLPFNAMPYCVLCRKLLPSCRSGYLRGGAQQRKIKQRKWWDWNTLVSEYHVWCTLHMQPLTVEVCPVGVRNRMHYLAVAVDIFNPAEEIVIVDGVPVVIDIRSAGTGYVAPWTDELRHSRQHAFAVHRLCRNLIVSLVKVPSTHKMICQYGRATLGGPTIHSHMDLWDGRLYQLLPFLERSAADTPLRSLLTRIAQFPVELRVATRTRTKRQTLSTAIGLVISTLPQLEMMKLPLIRDIMFGDGPCSINSSLTTIYGSTYLEHVDSVRGSNTDVMVPLHIKTSELCGIRIAIGDYGIGVLSFAFLYHDGTSSHSIGAPLENYHVYQTILGQDIHGLRIHRDVSFNLRYSE
jgi:hypothetical protein